MKSTLHLKFLIVYIIFGFLSIFTIATLTDNLTFNNLKKQTGSSLYQEASLVSSEYLSLYFTEDISIADAHLQLSAMEKRLNASIWFVDSEGNLLTSSHSKDYPVVPTVINKFNPLENGTDPYQISDYHGYFTEDVITAITPVISDYMPKGYLLVHKHLNDLESFHKKFMKTVYITFLVIYMR